MASILIVDDSPVVRDEVSQFLIEHDFAVSTANDGVEGLQAIKHNSDIKLVICDVNMPRMDGLTMIERVRGELNNTELHIIMLTTETDERMKARGKAAGIKGWIVKPFVGGSVVEKFRKLVYG